MVINLLSIENLDTVSDNNQEAINLSTIEITLEENVEEFPKQFLRGYCQPILRNGIRWNWTMFDEIDIRPCPDGSSGLAQFQCLNNGKWSEYGPNLGSCKSSLISRLEDGVRKQEAEDKLISKLSRFFKSNFKKQLYGGDIDGAVAIIRTLTDRLQYRFQTQGEADSKPNEIRKNYMQNFFQDVIRSVSTLISKQTIESWMDLDKDRRMNIVSNMLSTLDEGAFLLADFIDIPEILEETSSNIGNAILDNNLRHSMIIIKLRKTLTK